MYLVGLGVVLSMSVACAAQTDQEEERGASRGALDGKDAPSPDPLPPAPNPTPDPVCETLRGPGGAGVGLANPASVYCAELGFVAAGESCTFPDGTSCEQWSFYRGECGNAHSFCARQGGEVTAKVETGGGFTTTTAFCTLPTGATCKEQDFAATCRCE
ncbi:MAG: DUF333 domain-containing protein [Labilithrix sp.]|nr:DUF333 domain-containing protein [Labilithrix sp.]